MKYQSELIKEIVESRGHEKSSIHYESECVESWIEETKGAYPKLCDYQSEWLNYIDESPIGNFPYEIITDVTEATVNNVVPYEYKSAILKGQTLVNILDYEKNTFDNKTFINDEKIITHESTDSYGKIYLPPTHLVSGEKILIKVDVISNSLNETFYVNKDWSNESCVTETLSIPVGFVGEKIFIVTPEKKDGSKYLLRGETGNQTTGIIKFKVSAMVYQEGMENWDIPFFTGMQSVKMPVLTTTGKNLFDMNHASYITGLIHVSNQTINQSGITKAYYIPCEPNTSYTISKMITQYFRICETSVVPTFGCAISNPLNNPSKTSLTITTSESAKYLCFNVHSVNADTMDESEVLTTLQIEKGLVATSYEPYKSNILTVNEPVELRGIGDVQDTLDCLTGEVVQNIGEIVLDGSEEWKVSGHSNWTTCYTRKYILPHLIDKGTSLISDKMISYIGYDYLGAKDVIGVTITKEGYVCLKYLPNGTKPQPSEVSDYLNSNPITIHYPLETESIKTVDLSIQDQDGNTLRKIKPIEGTMYIHSDGTPLKPTITMEIPVEATTQNLASFIKEE